MDPKTKCILVITVFVVCSSYNLVIASKGDGSGFQKRCLSSCFSMNCSTSGHIEVFHSNQPFFENVLQWSCQDECRYTCMWQTVEAFHKLGEKTPQFHGKWPFKRIFGVQEPAAAFFSILNFLPHAVMLRKFRGTIQPSTRMYRVWSLYGLISMNTWFWSTVFHTRDFDWTEKMDYFCAFSIVTYSLMAFILRICGTNWNWISNAACVACLAMFFNHIYRMAFIKFDYGYNMTLNVSVGAVNSLCWIAWTIYHWKTKPHVKNALIAVLLLNGTILLEFLDFPPLLWSFDSHSLWHLSTVPIHWFWYKFITADCLDLQKELQSSDKQKLV